MGSLTYQLLNLAGLLALGSAGSIVKTFSIPSIILISLQTIIIVVLVTMFIRQKHLSKHLRNMSEQNLWTQKQVEQQRVMQMNYLQYMAKINSIIQQETDLEKMLEDILDCILSIFNSDRSWLVYPCDPDADSWKIVMLRSRKEYEVPDYKKQNISTSPGVSKLMKSLRDAGGAALCDTADEIARDYGVKAQMAMAIYPKVGLPWALGLHQCSHSRVWTKNEKDFFESVGRRIGDALSSLLFLQNLQERERNYREIFDASSEVIIIQDPQTGGILDVNPSMLDLFGYTREEALTLTLEDISEGHYPYDMKGVMENINLAIAQGPQRFEWLSRKKNGEFVWLEVNLRLTTFGGQERILAVSRDITERKQAEASIRKLNEDLERRVDERTAQLEAANKELEAFSYSVSHDLRTPLRAVCGFSQILKDDYANVLDSEGKDLLMRIVSASNRMGDLIDGLLKLSRYMRAEIQCKTIDLSQMVQAIANELRLRDSSRKINFIIEPNVKANGDETLLRNVLDNLLQNAWKFTSQNDQSRIEFGKMKKDGQPVYFVRDNGAGFDMSYAEKLFTPFGRLHTEKEYEGTGIGLATVQRIIRRHNGNIWAEGEVGKGATFYFTLNLPCNGEISSS
jgi:PAS domain S-box-containing protein